jgi:ligand-binding sensor domain-containing protein
MSVRRSLPALLFAVLLPSFAGATPPSFGDAWRWVRFTTESGLPSNFVTRVVEVPGGGVWAVTRTGLARFNGFTWTRVPAPAGSNGQPDGIVGDGRGGVIVVSGARLLVGNASGLRIVPLMDGGRLRQFTSCARGATGPVLVLGLDGTLFEWDGRQVRAHPPSRDLGRVYYLKQAGEHGVWASTDRGLWCWEGVRWRLRLRGRAPLPMGVFEHTNGSALAYIDSPVVSRGLWEWKGESEPSPIRRPVMTPVESITVAPGGETLIVHNTGEIVLRAGGQWTPLPLEGVRLLDARAAGFLANGDLWVATDHGLYVYRSS